MNIKANSVIKLYFLILTLVVALIFSLLINYDTSLKVYFFDIGQGDTTLIKTPDHRYILIDGGRDNEVVYKLGQYLPFYVRTIDLVVITHPDNDHIVGLNEVIKRYKVENILLTGVIDDSPAYRNILALIESKHINYLIASEVNRIKLTNQIMFNVLYPVENIVGEDFNNDNDYSIVNRLNYGSQCVLLMGDATKKVEQNLLTDNLDLNCEILKVGHHGSNTSSSQKFLESVGHKLAIISVGENNYGHPHQDVLNRFGNLKIPVLTTKSYGDIIVTLQKDGWIIN